MGSKQSPGLDSESERLRKSYDEYGKMICEKQNAMMIDYKKQSLIPINEYDDIDSEKIKDSRSKEQLLSAQKKQQRSSSLSLQNHSKDHLQRQLEIIKSTQKR